MNRRRLNALFLATLDLACVIIIFHVIGWLRGIWSFGTFDLPDLLGPFAVLVLAIHLIDGYSRQTDMLSLTYTSQHAIALLAAMLAMLIVTFVFIKNQYSLQSSRGVIVLSFIALIPATLSYRRWLASRTANVLRHRSFIFVGSQASCLAFKDTCETNHLDQQVFYVATDVADHESVSPWGSVEMHAVPQLFTLVNQLGGQVEAIVLHETSRDLPFAVSEKLMNLHFAGVPTYTLDLFHEIYWRKIPLTGLNQTWLFQEGSQVARDPVFARLKRIYDILMATAGLILFSPLLLLSAFAVWICDRGPVFFAQTRIGKNRVPFQIYKFRTMRTDAGTSGAAYTQKNDPRITCVGRLLRATRLDEFPQLWNVLRGDMSLIGPRAEWDKLVSNYEREIPCYHFRHLMKPGITGWAQVNYPYGADIEDTLRKLEYDLYYIRHFSFALDASIVLKTIHVMLGGKGR
jgi:exopolysaccharide biosynthesis polyprenyl glycosylphosphotransferase